MGEKNTTPVYENPTAVSFSLDGDGIRRRIFEIKEKHGFKSNKDFSLFLFGNIEQKGTIDKWTIPGSTTIPSIDKLVIIAQVAGVSLDWLVFGKDNSPKSEEKEKETKKPTVKTFLQCVDELLKAPAIKDVRIETDIDSDPTYSHGGFFTLFVTTRPAEGEEKFTVGRELLDGIKKISTALKFPPYHIAKADTIKETISAASDMEISSNEKEHILTFRLFSSYEDPFSPYERHDDEEYYNAHNEDHDED